MTWTRLAIALLLVSAGLRAQQATHAYAYFAPGAMTAEGVSVTTLHGGAGGEVLLAKGIGVGAELGILGPREGFGNGVLGVFSPGGSYHFGYDPQRKWDPFVAGGYTLFFRSDTANAFYLGGGVNYWFARRVAFRGEFRDHIWASGPTLHVWGVRMGFTFR